MKKGDTVRFKVAHYDSKHQLKEVTDEVLEGTIMCRDGGFLVIRVKGAELPYRVDPKHILQDG